MIKPIIATSFENIEYLDFISSNSYTLDLIYDFILKVNASKVELSKILNDEKLKAIEVLNTKYKEFKTKNNLVKDLNAKLHKLNKQPFDINDEVESALKLARKLLEENENLKSSDICIITTDIAEYAPIFRLYLPKYELKGFDSKGISLKLFNHKKTSNIQVKNAFESIEKELKLYDKSCQKFGLNIDLDKLKEKLVNETYILEDKIGIELTEANQFYSMKS